MTNYRLLEILGNFNIAPNGLHFATGDATSLVLRANRTSIATLANLNEQEPASVTEAGTVTNIGRCPLVFNHSHV